jgi:hypothetical protein
MGAEIIMTHHHKGNACNIRNKTIDADEVSDASCEDDDDVDDDVMRREV